MPSSVLAHVLERIAGTPIRTDPYPHFYVRDSSDYRLGPHTDSVTKIMSFLFYLPPDESMALLGTSIYAPKQADFRCSRGLHYRFDRFRLVTTMPYLPNSLFGFVRTGNSFHGVEPITATGICRDLLLYDIQRMNPPQSKPVGPG